MFLDKNESVPNIHSNSYHAIESESEHLDNFSMIIKILKMQIKLQDKLISISFYLFIICNYFLNFL